MVACMARLEVEGAELVLRLSGCEKIGALHGDIRVARTSVRAVTVSEQPWKVVRGIRAPGTGCPGLIMLGTTRGRGWKDFNAVYRRRPVVVVDLDGHTFARLVVTSDEALAVAARLQIASGSAASTF
jgi:hypothetical protein